MSEHVDWPVPLPDDPEPDEFTGDAADHDTDGDPAYTPPVSGFQPWIRIPPTHVIELMKALERELSAWETETGNRLPPNPSEEAP